MVHRLSTTRPVVYFPPKFSVWGFFVCLRSSSDKFIDMFSLNLLSGVTLSLRGHPDRLLAKMIVSVAGIVPGKLTFYGVSRDPSHGLDLCSPVLDIWYPLKSILDVIAIFLGNF